MKSKNSSRTTAWPYTTLLYFTLFNNARQAVERRYFYSMLATWAAMNGVIGAVAYFLPQPLQQPAMALRSIAIAVDLAVVVCWLVPSRAADKDKFAYNPKTDHYDKYVGSRAELWTLSVVEAFILLTTWPILKWEEFQGK